MRKPFLDNIRWSAVCLVLIYHVCYLFNGAGVPASIPNAANLAFFDNFACFVYPWLMVLLFTAAGMAARYSLQKRSERQFIKERTVKLLIPSTLGLFVLHWITGYINISLGGGLAYIPKLLVYPISAVSGIGPLWFIQMLFLFCCALLLLRKVDKSGKISKLCQKVNYPVLLLLFLVIYGAAQIFNLPVLIMYRFGIYFVAFLLGYFVFFCENVMETMEKYRICSLCLALITGIVYMIIYHGSDYTASSCLQSLITNAYLWFAVLAIFGFAKKHLNTQSFFCRYMTKTSYGLYILHYPILLAACCLLHYYCNFSAICNYMLALLIEVVLTFALYEIIRRIPVVRFLVLGIQKQPNPPQTEKS